MNHPSCSNGGPNLRVFKFVKFQITQLYLNICTASTNSLLRGRKGYLIVSYVITKRATTNNIVLKDNPVDEATELLDDIFDDNLENKCTETDLRE